MGLFDNLLKNHTNANQQDSPDTKGTINLTDSILPKEMDIYGDYIFRKKKDSHGFNLEHKWTKQTQSGYDVCFNDPFSDEELIITDKDIPLLLEQVDDSAFADSYDKISKYEGLEDEHGKEVNLLELASRLEPNLTLDPVIAEAAERIKNPAINQANVEYVANGVMQNVGFVAPIMPKNSQGFNLLSKIKKTNQQLTFELFMPNLSLIRTIRENIEVNDTETDNYIIDSILSENYQNFMEQLRKFIKSELNIIDDVDEISINQSDEKTD